ncbi:hypothetical protein D3Y57_03240 (plasmid) [Sphingomonas paeninsulae]|jgi:hypothetical protein|uniref:Uncharacterized protein n=1 Tax=Sphingomonas paeninsulae TaxID=2319844 RepID=A0A494T6Q5_SPHPE|nr:hypothetical protein [Sphingomonas paeninsulae]AYJ85069.1 hypothetical protein D3Y57_03240 [Sphingomonas paeninsulae]
MELKPGSRWKSAVCTTEVVIVRPSKGSVSLECGGHPMVALADTAPTGLELSPDFSGGTSVGKRYFDDEAGIEVLGSKPGKGTLGVDGRPLTIKEAKALPASD